MPKTRNKQRINIETFDCSKIYWQTQCNEAVWYLLSFSVIFIAMSGGGRAAFRSVGRQRGWLVPPWGFIQVCETDLKWYPEDRPIFSRSSCGKTSFFHPIPWTLIYLKGLIMKRGILKWIFSSLWRLKASCSDTSANENDLSAMIHLEIQNLIVAFIDKASFSHYVLFKHLSS